MKPRTRLQQEVARLSKRLPQLTETQKAYAFRHCFKHYAIKRADGTNICSECGHSWKSEHDLADAICGSTCPHCGMELESLRSRKSVFSDNEYFSIITTCKQFQVIRFFFVKSRYKAGQSAEYSILRRCNDGLPPMARQLPLPDCVACHHSTTTCGRKTATWKSVRTGDFGHTT